MNRLINHPWGWQDITALTIAICGWGGNFIAIRYAVLEYSNWTALTLRLILVSLLLAPFIRLPENSLKPLLILAAVLVLGHFGLLFLASQMTENVSAVSLLIQLNPAISILLAWWFLDEQPGRQRIAGLMIAMVAMIVLFYEPGLLNSVVAMLIATVSAAFMAGYSVLVRRLNKNVRPVDIIGWTAIIGTPMVAIIGISTERDSWSGITDYSINAHLGLLYTAVIASIASHGAWAWLCRRHPLSQITPFSLLVPFIAIGLSVMLFDELLTLQMLIAAGLLCLGLLVVVRSRT